MVDEEPQTLSPDLVKVAPQEQLAQRFVTEPVVLVVVMPPPQIIEVTAGVVEPAVAAGVGATMDFQGPQFQELSVDVAKSPRRLRRRRKGTRPR